MLGPIPNPKFFISLDHVSTPNIWSSNVTITLTLTSDYQVPEGSHLELRAEGYYGQAGCSETFKIQNHFFRPETVLITQSSFLVSKPETLHFTLKKELLSTQEPSSIYNHLPNGLRVELLLKAKQQKLVSVVEKVIQTSCVPFPNINCLIGDTFQSFTPSKQLSFGSTKGKPRVESTKLPFPMFDQLKIPMINVLVLGEDRDLFINTMFSSLSDHMRHISSPRLRLEEEFYEEIDSKKFVFQKEELKELQVLSESSLANKCRMKSFNLTQIVRLFDPLSVDFPSNKKMIEQLLLGKLQNKEAHSRKERTLLFTHKRLMSEIHSVVMLISTSDMNQESRLKQIQSTYAMITELGYNPLVLLTRVIPDTKYDTIIGKLTNLANQLKCSPNRVLGFELYEEDGVKSFEVDQSSLTVLHRVINLGNDRLEYLVNTDENVEKLQSLEVKSRKPSLLLFTTCFTGLGIVALLIHFLYQPDIKNGKKSLQRSLFEEPEEPVFEMKESAMTSEKKKKKKERSKKKSSSSSKKPSVVIPPLPLHQVSPMSETQQSQPETNLQELIKTSRMNLQKEVDIVLRKQEDMQKLLSSDS